MDQDNYTEISLVDVVAYFVKKFWILLTGALVGMALLLSYHYISANSAKNVEAYEKDLSKYKVNLSSLEGTLDSLNLKLDFANEVESISPLFSDELVYVSRIMIAVDSNLASNSESASNTVGQEIINFWNSLDLSSIVGSDLDNEILKASIIFEQSGQSLSIRVYGGDKSMAEKYASSILDAFVFYFDTREHLSVGSKTISTSVASKNEIAKNRAQLVYDKAELLKKIFDTEAEMNALKKEAPSKYHPLKNAAIGFFVGGVVVVVVLGMGYVSRNPVTCSFCVEKVLGVPFLGALFIENCFLSRLARRIMAERFFKTYDDSLAFLKSSFGTIFFEEMVNNKQITLISSVKDLEVEKKADKIIMLLNDEGYNATYIGNSSENPMTIKTIEDNGAVIFLERQWYSKMHLLSLNKDLASKMEKKILGFIIC